MFAIFSLVSWIGASLTKMSGQIGPVYDPLFYDVMVYIFGTMLFAVFLLAVIAFWLNKKGIGGTAKETWVKELDKHYEKEGTGLIPEDSLK